MKTVLILSIGLPIDTSHMCLKKLHRFRLSIGTGNGAVQSNELWYACYKYTKTHEGH